MAYIDFHTGGGWGGRGLAYLLKILLSGENEGDKELGAEIVFSAT